MPNARVDVAIVGAGPAGAWTAYLLTRGGARVALIDPSHPREKPCGGGITGRALGLVAPAIAATRLASVAVRSARFVHPRARTSTHVPLDSADSPALVVASRTAFDGALLAAARAAGAAVVCDRVAALTDRSPGFDLQLQSGTIVRAGF